MITKVLDFDQRSLSNSNVGLSHDLVRFLSQFFDITDLEGLDMRDFTYLQDLRDQLVVWSEDSHLLAFRSSTGLSFWTSLADDAFLPQGFCAELGAYSLESVRIILLFLGDVFRFSLGAASSACPFCPIQLHAAHIFSCPNCPFRSQLPSWGTVSSLFREGKWQAFILLLFSTLRLWANRTSFFNGNAKRNIHDFFNV
jgi:hypothetical protein